MLIVSGASTPATHRNSRRALIQAKYTAKIVVEPSAASVHHGEAGSLSNARRASVTEAAANPLDQAIIEANDEASHESGPSPAAKRPATRRSATRRPTVGNKHDEATTPARSA